MVKKTGERKEVNEEKKENFKTYMDSYTAVSKLWEDSYLMLYKPWLESSGELFEKAVELSKGEALEKYKEFYEEWVKIYKNSPGNFYSIQAPETNKEILEKLMRSAEESNNIYRSWIAELEENSRMTQEVLQGEPNPVKYKEVYDMWIKSYGKMFDELLTLPLRENIKDIFENFTGMPDIYSESFVQISKLMKDSNAKICGSWIGSIQKLYEKSTEISQGGASPEAYREFYTMWLDTYQESYGRLFDIKSARPSKELFESFAQSTSIYLSLYKSWIAAIEKLSWKAKELSKQTDEPETYRQYYNLWAKTYEMSFDIFFENTPTVGPFKDIMEPARNAARIYADTFTRGWTKSSLGSAT
ncbi:MAG: hypothetical protein KKA10_00265 [Euryarchaeota archaeon]|nr:hypothetical protein [Euryarchaeota archaeon]MCG2736595.1 hypothetical protein [Candidatus Methanoperedenaceae archaeon]